MRFQVTPEQSIFQILVPSLRLLLEESLSFSPCKGCFQLFQSLFLLRADLLPLLRGRVDSFGRLATLPAATRLPGLAGNAGSPPGQATGKHDPAKPRVCHAAARTSRLPRPRLTAARVLFWFKAVKLFLKNQLCLLPSLGEGLSCSLLSTKLGKRFLERDQKMARKNASTQKTRCPPLPAGQTIITSLTGISRAGGAKGCSHQRPPELPGMITG